MGTRRIIRDAVMLQGMVQILFMKTYSLFTESENRLILWCKGRKLKKKIEILFSHCLIKAYRISKEDETRPYLCLAYQTSLNVVVVAGAI